MSRVKTSLGGKISLTLSAAALFGTLGLCVNADLDSGQLMFNAPLSDNPQNFDITYKASECAEGNRSARVDSHLYSHSLTLTDSTSGLVHHFEKNHTVPGYVLLANQYCANGTLPVSKPAKTLTII